MKKNIKPSVIVYELAMGSPESFILQSKSTPRNRLMNITDGKAREIRYATNCKSPFVDEQVAELNGNYEDKHFNMEPIIFENGFLVVDSWKENLIAFLESHPKYGKEFFKQDNEARAKEDLVIMDLEDQARDLARKLDLETLKSVVRQLRGKDVDAMSVDEIKHDARLIAREDPDEFLAFVQDPSIEMKNIIHMAFSEGIMKFQNKDTEIWYNLSGNRKKLMMVPFGEDKYEAFERFLVSDEGHELLQTLENLLKAV